MGERKGHQRWDVTVEGREHRVDVRDVGLSREFVWYVDGVEVVRRKSSDDKVRLVPPEDDALPSLPDLAIAVRCSTIGGPRRVTLFGGDDAEGPAAARAALGIGGLDLLPAPGSRAARREEMIRLHPRRYLLLRTAGGVASVVVPLVLGLLAVRFAAALPWPDIPWPSISWPDVPRPEIPWSGWSLPSWQLPAWLRWILDHATYVWPVVLAAVLARGEVNRRRKQDAQRTATAERRTTDDRRPADEL